MQRVNFLLFGFKLIVVYQEVFSTTYKSRNWAPRVCLANSENGIFVVHAWYIVGGVITALHHQISRLTHTRYTKRTPGRR